VVLTEITTWYLEMASPDRLRPGRPTSQDVTLTRAEIPCPELNRFLYRAVGGDWYWIDRLDLSYDAWRAWAEQIETWVAYVRGTPVGYFELKAEAEGTVDIAHFGLLPWAIGRGLGGWLLTRAVERAWALDARTVTVNTCSLDGPHALANYQARGFAIARVHTAARELPDQPPGPWRTPRRQ
jgi:GNAT superfamily N-acetyltransferase